VGETRRGVRSDGRVCSFGERGVALFSFAVFAFDDVGFLVLGVEGPSLYAPFFTAFFTPFFTLSFIPIAFFFSVTAAPLPIAACDS
jgi:hypothetical protein